MTASVNLRFQIADVTQTLVGIETNLADPSPLMSDVLLVELRSVQRRFEQQGSPERWHELAESTKRQRAARLSRGRSKKKARQVIGAMQILRDTGALLQSVGGGASGPFSAQGGVGEFDRESAVIRTSHPGAWNQFANTRTGAPARIIFAWEEQDVEDVQAMAGDFAMARPPYGSGA